MRTSHMLEQLMEPYVVYLGGLAPSQRSVWPFICYSAIEKAVCSLQMR